ncbi:MAG: TRIC cation channel family protein [Candidatus Eremiobacteraeota bacterium]|nr:TRIC cation channel family protein [Candidatus Eremiobacteraeota bacterium]
MRSFLQMVLISGLILGLAWFFSTLSLTPKPDSTRIKGSLRVGWMEYYPYQFTTRVNGVARREGLGLKMVEAAFHRAGYSPEFVEMAWQEQLNAFADNQLDVIMLASPSPERLQTAHFSQSYANFKLGTFYSKAHIGPPPEDPKQLAAFCRQKQIRIGMIKGFQLPGELAPILEDADREGRLIRLDRAEDNLQDLADGDIEVAFVDELVGFSVRTHPWANLIGYQELDCSPDSTCLMFNRKTITPEMVGHFNQALQSVADDGSQSALIRTYLYPRLLGILTQSQLFRIIIIAAAMFAGFTGVLIAHREGYDWVGALVLAACPAVGGGVLRDLIVSRNPLGVVADPANLLGVACLVVAVGLFLRFAPKRWREGLESMDPSQDQRLLFFDTLGLAAYTVTNVFLAMSCACEPLWLWGPLLAVFQNGGGGAIRDILIGRAGHIAILKGVIYGEIAFFGALCLSIFFIYYSQRDDFQEEHMIAASLITMLGVVIVRTLVIAKGWRASNF